MNQIVLGLPKGSLQDATFSLMRKAGWKVHCGSRSYVPTIDDPEIDARLIRAQEISRYVELGMLDVGMTGHDWVVENDSDVVDVATLVYAKQGMRPVRWVLAVPNDSDIKCPADLEGKRIATEAVGLTTSYLKKHNVSADVEFSWGATEVKAPELVDAIVEITETGSSLRANDLRIVDTVLESSTRLIANKASWEDPEKRKRIEKIAVLMQGALAAESRVLLKMNVKQPDLENVVTILPSLHAPTVNTLSDDAWVAVETVIEEAVVRDIIPALLEAGATGIIELPLNKVIS